MSQSPDNFDDCKQEFRRVACVLDDLLSRDRRGLVSGGIEFTDFSDRGGREWPPCWSIQFRSKWPIQSEFGLVTVDLTYAMPESVNSPQPIRIRWRAEVFQTGSASRFNFIEETNMALEAFRESGVIAVVREAIELGSMRIQAVAGSPEV